MRLCVFYALFLAVRRFVKWGRASESRGTESFPRMIRIFEGTVVLLQPLVWFKGINEIQSCVVTCVRDESLCCCSLTGGSNGTKWRLSL